MASVAFDANSEGALIVHLIIAALMVRPRKSTEDNGWTRITSLIPYQDLPGAAVNEAQPL